MKNHKLYFTKRKNITLKYYIKRQKYLANVLRMVNRALDKIFNER